MKQMPGSSSIETWEINILFQTMIKSDHQNFCQGLNFSLNLLSYLFVPWLWEQRVLGQDPLSLTRSECSVAHEGQWLPPWPRQPAQAAADAGVKTLLLSWVITLFFVLSKGLIELTMRFCKLWQGGLGSLQWFWFYLLKRHCNSSTQRTLLGRIPWESVYLVPFCSVMPAVSHTVLQHSRTALAS